MLPENLSALLRNEHAPAIALRPSDVEELRDVALGNVHPEYRVKALALVDSPDLLLTALRDDSADLTVRAAGATLLSKSAAPSAESALLEALQRESSPPVRHKIIGGLARVGGVESLDALVSVEDASFAQSVIAYRHGLSGYEFPVISESELMPADGPPFGASGSVPLDARRLAGDVYGLGLPESAAVVNCGGRTLAISVIPIQPAVPALVGLIALRAESDGSFHTAMLVFCWPESKDTLNISVQRITGTTAYFGQGDLDGGFRLDAVRGPGARATTITGPLDRLQIQLGETQQKQFLS
ncbi:HEAT repeat domain-containing protein [Nonomuraea sp. NPDC050451]|uniref:HEAT repeat domain-containing protein n=1 Tax=Nonomuraea sp. NPDC050451 TaxID=3364364 RepID=UPI0037BB688A